MSVTKKLKTLKDLLEESDQVYGDKSSLHSAVFDPAKKFTAHYMLHVGHVPVEEPSPAELLLHRLPPQKS